MEQVPVISINLSKLEANSGFKINLDLLVRAAYGAVFGDIFMRCIYHMRPYEKVPGSVEAVHQKWLSKCQAFVSGKHMNFFTFQKMCRQMVEDFDAIPINDVQSIIKDIIENGSVGNKAYMAITAGTMTQQMAAQYKINATEGVFVYSVEDGGAGDKAGLKLGDVITKLNDTQITSMEDLSAAKKGFKAGDTVTLTVLRDGKEITTQLTFDAQPQTTDDTTDSSQSGDNNYNNGNNGYSGNGYSDLYDYFFGRH